MIRKHLGLRIPLTLAVVTLLVVGVGQAVIAFIDAKGERQTVEQYVFALAKSAATASVDPVLVRDYPQLRVNCQGLLKTPGVVAAQVLRADGTTAISIANEHHPAATDPDAMLWIQAPIQIIDLETQTAIEQLGVIRVGVDRSIFWRRALQLSLIHI